jgi:RNA polymerase subunit RPABC4/transcription elongation factor Spt4
MSPDLVNTIIVMLEVALSIFGGFVAALWISLVIWTFRDIRSRSRDIFAQLLATLLVLIFNLPGLLLYVILRPQERLAETYERALEEEALLQDIEERAQCPGCKRQIEADFVVCPSCHTPLKKRCVRCDRVLHLKWNMCPYCGAVQTAASVSQGRESQSRRYRDFSVDEEADEQMAPLPVVAERPSRQPDRPAGGRVEASEVYGEEGEFESGAGYAAIEEEAPAAVRGYAHPGTMEDEAAAAWQDTAVDDVLADEEVAADRGD